MMKRPSLRSTTRYSDDVSSAAFVAAIASAAARDSKMVNVVLVIVACVTISFISCDQECGSAYRPAVVALDTGARSMASASQTF